METLPGPARPIPCEQLAAEVLEGRCVDWEVLDFVRAGAIADILTERTGELHVPVDRGDYCAPRYGMVRVPRVGDLVSKSFNGDTYIIGKVVRVSASLRRVETQHDDGRRLSFYRRKLTASWLNGGMWALVRGHHEERNPEF